MSKPAAEYDIVMATDFRFPGGTTASVVEEIEAQYRAGYRTGVLHLPSPIQRSRRPFADRIRRVLADGKAELVDDARPVRTKLLLIRHPSVMSAPPQRMPAIEADHIVLVVNQVPEDGRGAAPYYDVAGVHQTIRNTLGKDALWAPIGPGVRQAVRAGADVPMLEADWENIIDLDAWRAERDGFVSDRPVIGRHSRGHWSKWPVTREEILAAYPDDPRYQVRILGGTEAPEDILGTIPPNWTTLPFDSVPIASFLADIDFMVYFHHPGLVEAFGRVVLEGMASGAVCMAPPALEPIFGEACAYGTPRDVRAFVDGLYADPAEFARHSERGIALVRERFSHQAHLDRVSALIGSPSGQPGQRAQPGGASSTLIYAVGQDAQEVAHLVDAIGDDTIPVVLTDTVPVPALGRALIETVPAVLNETSRTAGGLGRRLAHLVRAHDAKRVLFLAEPGASVSGLGDDVQTMTVARSSSSEGPGVIGPGWAARELPAAARRGRLTPRVLAERTMRKGIGLARRRAPQWARRTGRAGLETVTEASRRAAALRSSENATVIPVSAVYPHLAPNLPTVLVVVPSTDVEPGPTLAALTGRAQAASSFRLALLAPDTWAEAAASYGITLETWVPVEAWPRAYTVRRSEYARARVTEVSRLVRPAAVVNIDRTIASEADPGGVQVLDLLEAAGRSRQ